MDIAVFIQIFIPVVLLMLSVGPVFITIANISMLHGYRQGFFVAIATFLGNVVYITIGALAANEFISMIPKPIMMFLPIIGACFLLNLAHSFWKKDISKIKDINVNKFNMAILVKMFCLTLSSPVAIIGYGVIFTSIATNIHSSLLSALLGGYCGAITGKILIITFFGTLGKKFSKRILNIINKVSAGLLCFYATLLIVKVVIEFVGVI